MQLFGRRYYRVITHGSELLQVCRGCVSPAKYVHSLRELNLWGLCTAGYYPLEMTLVVGLHQ